jgi:hypothetical protein
MAVATEDIVFYVFAGFIIGVCLEWIFLVALMWFTEVKR